jgi:hypothetical protein
MVKPHNPILFIRYQYMFCVYVLIVLLATSMAVYKYPETFQQIFSPMSNSELRYDMAKWNDPDVKEYNNCYSYATNIIDTSRTSKPHPGYTKNITTSNSDFTCDVLNKHVLLDHPKAYKTDFETPCKCNYYKAYLAADPKKDFHLYKQDADGYWSHKPGSLNTTRVDASKNKIVNPATADKKYKNYNYRDSCMFFCVPSEKSCK